jgi:hypothetical protein
MPGTRTKNNVGVAANYKRKNLASFAKKRVLHFNGKNEVFKINL